MRFPSDRRTKITGIHGCHMMTQEGKTEIMTVRLALIPNITDSRGNKDYSDNVITLHRVFAQCPSDSLIWVASDGFRLVRVIA